MGSIFPEIETADIIENYANNEMYCRRKEIQGNIDNLGEEKSSVKKYRGNDGESNIEKGEKKMTVTERKEENMILDKLLRALTEKIERPEFPPGGVPVKVAAAVYGKAPYFVQEGIRAGWLPIGHMKPGEQKDNFYISPLKLWQDTGFEYKGQSVEEIEQWKKEMKENKNK